MWLNSQETTDLVTFTEKILNGKLHFLFSVGRLHTKVHSEFGKVNSKIGSTYSKIGRVHSKIRVVHLKVRRV